MPGPSSVTVGDSMVYVLCPGNDAGGLQGFDKATMQLIAHTPSQVIMDAGMRVFPDPPGEMISLLGWFAAQSSDGSCWTNFGPANLMLVVQEFILDPANSEFVVANLYTFGVSKPNTLFVSDGAGNLEIPAEGCQGVESDGDLIYVACSPNLLRRFNRIPVLHQDGEFSVGSQPVDVAVDDSYVYVTCSGSNTLQKYNKATMALVEEISTASGPAGVDVDGGFIYVACRGSDKLQKIAEGFFFIRGTVWNDLNGNGIKEQGEPGLLGRTVYIDANDNSQLDLGETSVLTGSDGSYTLPKLPGNYRVREVIPIGWAETAPLPGYHDVTLASADENGKDFGNSPSAAISGLKFHDKNANGQKDADEPPLSGWEIQLKDGSDKLLQTTTTSSEAGKEGTYEFSNLQPGTYRVYEVQKNGWVRTAPAGEYHTVTLTGSPSSGNLFGNNQLAISGLKFHDKNANGQKDADEPPLSGWEIQLKDESDKLLQTTTTSSEPGKEGVYEFLGLEPGTYRIYEVPQKGWVKTAPAGEFHAVTLTNMPSRENMFGNNQLAISGLKFQDKNANGIKEDEEPPLSGWEIQLKDGSDKLLQTTTTSSEPGKEGVYGFLDLEPGTYRVYEVPQKGWVKTAPAGEYHTVTLTNMPSRENMFGNNQLAISGLKFQDKNANGQKDDDEPLLSGWEIQLKDESDNLLQTVTTSAEPGKEGTYKFIDLEPGTYRVYEVPQKDWVKTAPAGEYHTVTLTNMPSVGNLFGNVISSGLSGLKFEDLNANGAKDAGEPGLAGWTIKLRKEVTEVASTQTAADGSYSFAGIAPGSYTVEEVAQSGWTQSYPATPGTHPVNLVSGVDGPTDLYFGNFMATGFSGMKFEDLNANGAKDAGEPGLAGWTIKLMKGATEVASTQTVADGSYSFAGIAPGSYKVEEVLQSGWTQSYPSTGTHGITLVSGVAGPTDLDFGNFRSTGLSGLKFEDLNANGAKDAGEPGLAGWTIKLMKEGTEVTSTQTAADGSYSFAGIAPGSYKVEEVLQSGWTQSYPSTGTHGITLVSGVAGPTDINFGNWRTTVFSGMKFEDLNANGAKDAGEPGLAGWTIRLLKEGAEVASTQTAADGSYSFADIAPGSYTVEEVAQSGWTQSYPATPGTHPVNLVSGVAGPTDINFGNRKLLEAFQVAITADQQTVLPGQQLVFYITVNRDININLDSLTVEYTLPKGLNFVNSNYSPLSVTQNADGSTTIIWTFSSFSLQTAAQMASSHSASASPTDAPLLSTTITVTSQVKPDAPESLTGTVVVTGTSSEAAISEAKGSVSVNVEKMPDQPIHLNKTSDLKEVWPGATIGYTIAYESRLMAAHLTGVVITEQASSDLVFLSASPVPDLGTDNVWSIGQLGPGEKGTINVFFQVKNASNLSFFSQSSVSGSGFVNSYRRLSTETESQGLRNSVTLTCKEFTPISTSYFVKLRDSDGTSLLKTEHGSGEYRSEEVASLQMQNRSIRTAGSLKAAYLPTSFLLPGGKSINYSSEIATSTITRNRATQASTSQEIRYAKSLKMDEKLLADKNETLIAIDGSVQGQAHLGVLKKDGEKVKPSPVFESSQDYSGDFRFNHSLEDYGGNVRQVRNATGQGQAASDQRLKKSQRSYEHGSGSYESEEQVSTAESYLAKDLSVSHDAQHGYGKWKSGIWSKSTGKSYLGQQVSSADFIKEETKASGLNDLSSNLSYRGQGRFRAVYESGNRSMLDQDEEYAGQYTIERKVRLGGVSRFDLPHLTLNKTGRMVNGTATVDYTITVLNDGNTALGPVYVWDLFPAGTDYLSSSLKPTRLQPGYANWSLLYLGIGQSATIGLKLNLTDPQDELVNLVYASGGHNYQWVTAGNMSVIQFGWLGCCEPDLLLEKQARVDVAEGRVIWYRIILQNRARVGLAAQIIDRLPAGLKLLNASAEPQILGSDLVWVTTIPAGESRFIEYRALASQDGRFVNTAQTEVHALDGSGGATVAASATVTIGEATSYAEDGWLPPKWGLDRMEMICDDEIAGDGGGCSSCLSCSCPADEE